MKKTVTALAIAAAMGATSANAMEWEARTDTGTLNMEIYGNIQLIYIDVNNDEGDGEDQIADNGSTIGVAGEHEWDNGLTGYFKVEWEHDVDEEKRAGGIDTGDQAYVGVKGAYGDIRAGSWDGIYEDSINDIIDPWEFNGPTGADGQTGEGDAIAYFSPSFGGFSIEAQATYKGDGEDFTIENPDGTTITNPDEIAAEDGTAVQAVLKYDLDWIALHAGVDNRGLLDDADPTYALAGSADLAPFTISAKVEYAGETADDANDEAMRYGVFAGYEIMPGLGFWLGAQQVEPDEGDSRLETFANVNYAIADNMYFYAEYGNYDRDNEEGDFVGVGTVYSF